MAATDSPPTIIDKLIEKFGSIEFVFHVAADHAPIGIVLVDEEQRVAYENISAGRILGKDYIGLGGRHLSEIFGDQYRSMLVETASDQEHPRLKNNVMHEVVFTSADGEERHVEVVFYPLAASTRFTLCFLTDVTDFKMLHAELQRSATFFHNLIESSVDGIIAADMKGTIILFNSGAQQMLGYTKEEAGNLHVGRLYPEGVAREILRKMRSDDYGGKGKLLRHELICITKDGRQIPMSLSGGIIYDGGTEFATYGIFTDLRAIRKMEQDLDQTSKALVQSEKMAGLGRLAAGVAHEINNPMSGIMLYSNLILEQLGENHPSAADLKIIIHEAERCKQIVNDLLEFSHQTSYRQTGVDLNEQIRQALGILAKQALFHNIEVVLELEDGLAHVLGNPIRMNQVLINIIVNAAQAMNGTGRLAIATRHRSSGQIVEVSISDTGPGIDKDTLPQIFDPFFTTKANEGGTGLGLSVSYAIVKEHKGGIRVESAPGQGATFHLRFPAMEGEPKVESELPPEQQMG